MDDKERIELFYIGGSFYIKSGFRMSSIYTITKKRYDWGFVRIALRKGCSVLIRPATKKEMNWAKRELLKITWNEKKRREKEHE